MLINKTELVKILRYMADRIEENDSFEGRLVYSCLDENVTEPEQFEVDVAFRHGNLDGQGSMFLIMPSTHNKNDSNG